LSALKYLMPSNWDERIVAEADPAFVDSLYAKAGADDFGGGRPSFVLRHVDRDRMVFHIAAARRKGLGFIYLLNASCFSGRSLSGEMAVKLNRLMDFLLGAGVTGVTVADPVLAGSLVKKYPFLKVGLSLFSMVSSVDQARRYEDLGVSSILLSNPNNFSLIGAVRSAVSCRITLLANLGCNIFCNEGLLHSYFDAHSSQSGHHSSTISFDHHRLICSIKKIADPVSMLKTMYVRPEDAYLYERAGVDLLKFVDRSFPAEAIINLYRYYMDRSFDGNFLSLVNPSNYVNSQAQQPKRGIDGRNAELSSGRLSPVLEKIPPFNIFIDNTALCGMKEEIMKSGVACAYEKCSACGICREYFERSAVYSEESRLATLAALRSVLGGLASSKLV